MRLLSTILAVTAMQLAAGCILDSSSPDPAEHEPALGTAESAAQTPPCVRTCFTEMLSSPQTGGCLGCLLDLNGESSFFPGMNPTTCDVMCTRLRLYNGECTDGPL